MTQLEELVLKHIKADYAYNVENTITLSEVESAIDEAQEELSIYDSESGATTEYCYDFECNWEKTVEEAHKATNNIYRF